MRWLRTPLGGSQRSPDSVDRLRQEGMGKEVRALGKREGEEGWKSDRERVKEKGKGKTSGGEGKEGDGVDPSLDTPVDRLPP